MSTKINNKLVLVFQALFSLGLIIFLVKQAKTEAVCSALEETSLFWLSMALLVNFAALTLHEIRVWFAIKPQKASLKGVMGIGFMSGILNFILPIRLGDIAAIALISKEEKVPAPISISAVGLVAFLEAGFFGVVLVGLMVLRGSEWAQLVGQDVLSKTFNMVTGLTFVGFMILGVISVLSRDRKVQEDSVGIKGLITYALNHTGGRLRHLPLFLNMGMALVQVLLIVLMFYLLLPAVGVGSEAPWLTSSLVFFSTALASIVLPPGMGAGNAAASVFVFSFFGLSEASALAYAALVWFTTNIPTVILGFFPLWKRLGTIKLMFL